MGGKGEPRATSLSIRAARVIVRIMRSWAYASLGLGCLVALLACGSRTGLLVPEDEIDQQPDGDDTTPDASTRDGGRIEDALPPIDVSVPHEGGSLSCAEAGSTLIYVVSEDYQLLSFDPGTGAFVTIGDIDCPTATGGDSPPTPFSMAVDHTGIAYVLYNDGELFRVSTATAACRSTGFVTGQLGFNEEFGMGYSQNSQGTAETLYVASSSSDGLTSPSRLATIQTTNFRLSIVGALQPQILNAELTGTGAGDLFAFYATSGTDPCDNTAASATCPDSAIGQIDKTTGRVTNETVFRGVPQGDAWAFAFWGGDFYLFTAPRTGTSTIVYRFRPADESLVRVATRSNRIVGAGVSTCAPAD
jgi:hypothetical protein